MTAKNLIKTKYGSYYYESIPLYHGRKLIDINVCTENLKIFKNVMDSFNIKFGLIFGTLLGAVRSKAFIDHDEDVDVYIFNNDRNNLINILYHLRVVGFEVARYDGDLLSLIRGNDYIDIYIFKRSLSAYCCNQMALPLKNLSRFESIYFLGLNFNVPAFYVELLVHLYGNDWQTPKKNYHANPLNFYEKTKFTIKKILPVYIVKMIKKNRE